MSRNITIVVIILIIVLLAAYLVWLQGRNPVTTTSPSPSAVASEVIASPVVIPTVVPTASSSARPIQDATKSGRIATRSAVPARR